LQENDNPTQGEDSDLDEMRVWLERWMDRLNDQERMIIRLRFWEDLTGPEIARAMKISPEQAVYPLLQKALMNLRDQAQATYRTETGRHSSVSQSRK
jgi:RNA polymerase sigma factor (sigma-70 family)